MPRALLGLVVLGVVRTAGAQATYDWSVLERSRTYTPKPTASAISAEDLRARLFAFADDSMKGRELGNAGNVKGTAWIASELKRLGFEPAGDNGGYLQLVPVVQRAFDEASRLTVGDQAFEPWKDFIMRDQGFGQRAIANAPVVWGGIWGDAANLISRDAADGKVVVIKAKATETGAGIAGLPNRQQVNAYFAKAAAVLVMGREAVPEQSIAGYKLPSGGMKEDNPTPVPSYVYITSGIARAIFGSDPAALAAGTAGRGITAAPRFVDSPIPNPAYNVVGILRGSDAKLRDEFVAIGAHNDHIGVEANEPVAHDSAYVVNHLFREQGADAPDPKLTAADYAKVNGILADIRKKTNGASARIDSVYNGADDDGSGSVSVLEIAEYFAGLKPAQRPKRSLLFVWHVGEEEGLFGSQWYTDHPTVPRDQIVAQLNMDMVGRGDASDVTGTTKDGKPIHGGASYVQLVGSRRLSAELGDLVEKVNMDKKHNMQLDYSLDADGHPQNIYCRSDHYSYARYGIPVTFFTTGGHADYHQLTDEPQYINYEHMFKVASFVRDIATEVGNQPQRPKVDKPKPDPKGACQQ